MVRTSLGRTTKPTNYPLETRKDPKWGATFRMAGATTNRMAGGEELKAA
jgi:hypothetical protein